MIPITYFRHHSISDSHPYDIYLRRLVHKSHPRHYFLEVFSLYESRLMAMSVGDSLHQY